jgi:hypothetical protein
VAAAYIRMNKIFCRACRDIRMNYTEFVVLQGLYKRKGMCFLVATNDMISIYLLTAIW